MMNTIRTMMAVVALAIEDAKADDFSSAWAKAHAEAEADIAKIHAQQEQERGQEEQRNFDFEQMLKKNYAPWLVSVGSHYVSISCDIGMHWKGGTERIAQFIALDGLLRYPESGYFEATVNDANGESKVLLQRADYPTDDAILAAMDKLHAKRKGRQ